LALFAGAVDERIAAVGCLEIPVSYLEMAKGTCTYPPSAYLFDVLRHFDLDDVAALVSPRPIYVGGPLDGQHEPLTRSVLDGAYKYSRAVYHAIGADGRIRFEPASANPSTQKAAAWFLQRWQGVQRDVAKRG
jgi:hypothetical protein